MRQRTGQVLRNPSTGRVDRRRGVVARVREEDRPMPKRLHRMLGWSQPDTRLSPAGA